MSSARPETMWNGTDITSVVCEDSQPPALVKDTSQATRTNHAHAYQTFLLQSVIFINTRSVEFVSRNEVRRKVELGAGSKNELC